MNDFKKENDKTVAKPIEVFNDTYRHMRQAIVQPFQHKLFDDFIDELKNEIYDNIEVDDGIEKYIDNGRLDDVVNDLIDERVKDIVSNAIDEIDMWQILSDNNVITSDDFDWEEAVTSNNIDDYLSDIEQMASRADNLSDDLNDDYQELIVKFNMVLDILTTKGIIPKPEKPEEKPTETPYTTEQIIMEALEWSSNKLKEQYGGKEFVMGFTPDQVDARWNISVRFNNLIKVTPSDINEFLTHFREEAGRIFEKHNMKYYFNATIHNYAGKWIIDAVQTEVGR